MLAAVFRDITSAAWPFWLLAAAGAVAGLASRATRKQVLTMLAYALFAFLSVCPGFYFRDHYFVVLLPAIALLAAFAIVRLGEALARRGLRDTAAVVPVALFAAACLGMVVAEAEVLFRLPPAGVSRLVYGGNPFPEVRVIADSIAVHARPGDRVVVFGSEPELFFYANRRSATGYIYMYGLVESQPQAARMRAQAIREIESARPEWLVVVNNPGSWLLRPGSDTSFLAWAKRFTSGPEYEAVGLVEMMSAQETVMHWGAEAAGQAAAPLFLRVYHRKASPLRAPM